MHDRSPHQQVPKQSQSSGSPHMTDARVTPSLAELGRIAATANYAPIYREVLADVETPVSALLKLGAGPGSFLLESVEGGEFVARYSFVAAGLERSLAIYDDHATYVGSDGSADLSYTDPLDLVERMVAREGVVRLPGLPRFGGGAVGYLSYELARKFEPRIPLAANNPLKLPLGHLLMVDSLLVFDHLRRTIKAVTYVPLNEDLPTDYRRGCERLDDLLERLRGGAHTAGLEDAPGPRVSSATRLSLSTRGWSVRPRKPSRRASAFRSSPRSDCRSALRPA